MHEAAQRPQVLSRTPGRLRLRLADRIGEENGQRLEAALCRRPGVSDARLNLLTGNLLIHFDPRVTSAEALTAAVEAIARASRGACAASRPEPAPAGSPAGRRGVLGWELVRAGVRGVVGHALVDTAFYAVVFAEPFGLPLAGLGALHLGLDVLVWTATLVPFVKAAAPLLARNGGADGTGRASASPRRLPYRKREGTALCVQPC